MAYYIIRYSQRGKLIGFLNDYDDVAVEFKTEEEAEKVKDESPFGIFWEIIEI